MMAGKNLQTLRDQLEGQTRDIQNLQKEVEQATQRALSSLPSSYHGHHPIPTASHQFSLMPENVTRTVVDNSAIVPLHYHHHQVLQRSFSADLPSSCNKSCLMPQYNPLECDLGGSDFNVKTPLWKSLKEYIIKDLPEQSNQSRNMTGLQNQQERKIPEELNVRIQSLEMERDAVLFKRFQESKALEDRNEQLHETVQELQKASHLQNEMLKKSNVCNALLRETVQEQVEVLQDIGQVLLSYEERSGKHVFEQGCAPSHHISSLATTVKKVLQELETEAEDQLNSLKTELKDKEALLALYKERFYIAVNEQEQQVAALTQEASNSLREVKNVNSQMETFQEQVKGQCVVYEERIAYFELTVSQLHSELQSNKKKAEDLKMQLVAADSTLTETHDKHAQDIRKQDEKLHQLRESLQACEKQLNLEKEQRKQLLDENKTNILTNEKINRDLVERSKEIENLHAKVKMLKDTHERQMKEQIAVINEKNEGIKFILSQLESTKELLDKTAQDLQAKTFTLQSAEKSIEDLKMLLEEKDATLKNTMGKLKKLRAENKKCELDNNDLDKMQTEIEKMRVYMAEKDHYIKALHLQIEHLFQAVGQQSEKLNVLQARNAQLLEEMKSMAEKNNTRICELELEKTELSNATIKLRTERDRLMSELKDTRHNYENLEADYAVLKKNYQVKNEELVGTSASLKTQLHTVLTELEQTKSILRIIEGCDGHAVKVALRMQKKMTAKREKIDTLQSRIQFLEEALSRADKEKQHLKEEDKLTQEHVNAERCRLSENLETLRDENKTLKDQVSRMQASMDKAALRFSESQSIIQRLEKESMRLRIKHTLEMKGIAVPTSEHIAVPVSCASVHLPFTQSNLRDKPLSDVTYGTEQSSRNMITEKPTRDRLSLSDKLHIMNYRGMDVHQNKINDDKPHHLNTSMDPSMLFTADLQDKDPTFSFANTECPFLTTPCYTSSPKKPSIDQRSECKSPVHSLLTTPVDAYEVAGSLSRRPLSVSVSSQDSSLGEPSTENLQSRLEKLQTMAKDLQAKNKEMSQMVRKKENRTAKDHKNREHE
ncbi:coiled-coil domain-containing protein 158 [Pelobates fuscus]|uniref:coiled-coil domain-containing protein 158 n=1 Tax=Pelobates fuscus TaxID=191477 RepID=UPI002FE4E2FD